jgi:hypothetical protein
MSISSRSTLFALILTLIGAGIGWSQESDDVTDDQRVQQLENMKRVALMIDLLADGQKNDSVVKLQEKPVLRYRDDTRKGQESSLWIWSSGGRPSAILAIEFYANYPEGKGANWLYEIASLSAAKIGAKTKTGLNWTAKKPGLELQTIKDAKPPAATAPQRLSQMRNLRGRFSAHESAVIEGSLELRPMPSPLFRYADAEASVMDGAIFAFANGTNPEVLLVLEAHKMNGGEPEWRYGLVQMTGGAVNVKLDGTEVWQRGEADPPAVRDSYVNGWIKADDVPKE